MKLNVAVFLAVSPWIVSAQAPSAKGVNFYSIAREMDIGRLTAAQLERDLPVVRVPQLDAYVARIAASLADRTDRAFVFSFTIYDDRKFPAALPNATFAMPKDAPQGQPSEPIAVAGGAVFVPLSLLADARNEAEFAFQLAHAMAHINLRHATRAATRDELANIAVSPVIVERTAMADAAQIGLEAGFMTFIRTLERQADRTAVITVAAAGYDPEAATAFLMEAPAPAGRIFAAHPTAERRIAETRQAIAEMPARNYSADTGQFAEMRELALRIR